MNSAIKICVFSFLIAGLLASQIGCPSGRMPHDGVVAVVSVEPHAFLVERIGGERVHVEVLIPAGKEPETYQVTPNKLNTFAHAHLFFRTGMPIEDPLLPKLQSLSKSLRIVDLRDGLPLRTLEIHQCHGSDHVYHGQIDPHIWLAPTLLKAEAETVLRALHECDPDGAETYQTNFENILHEIEAVRVAIAELLATKQNEIVFVFHPAYGYFCEEFGLRQWAIEYEGKSPKPQQIADLIEETKKLSGEPKIFVQPEFNQSAARVAAGDIGAKVVVHSPLERNVLQSMLRFAQLVADFTGEQ